ncbi:RICIN domain-containing protein [Streptomyces cirratus]|uniref:RICIN domain-containing protein n=1 Tax=Streptomyces cirratus TaxID=68187 RepID=UPI0036069E7E
MGGSVVVVNTASAATVDTSAWYVLVNRDTGKALDNLGYATNDGAPLVQWSRTGAANQQWKFIDAGDGNYRLQNRNSGKVLDDYNWSKTEGSELVQWSDLNGANQQFHVEKSSDGYVRLINRFSGKAVEVPGGTKADGAHIAQYHDWNGPQQQWRLVPAGSAGGTGNAGSSGSSATPTAPATPGGSGPASQAPSGTHPTSAPPATGGSGTSTKSFMGSKTVLVGGSMDDASANAAPFDVQYAYVHSQPAPSSDYYTAARCKDAWTGWWGCWNGSTTAPGTYVTWRDAKAAQATYQGKPRPQKFLWTWYSLRDLGDAVGQGDGPGEVQAINRADLLTRYMNDYRFFLQKIGTSHDMIDIEPDFWGYVRSLGNPHQVPAQVTAANPTDCGSQENSAAGLAQCLISMAHKYAPNTGAGLHLTCWDWQNNTQPASRTTRPSGRRTPTSWPPTWWTATRAGTRCRRTVAVTPSGTTRGPPPNWRSTRRWPSRWASRWSCGRSPWVTWRRTTPATTTRTTRSTGSCRTWTRWRTRTSPVCCSVPGSRSRPRSSPTAGT